MRQDLGFNGRVALICGAGAGGVGTATSLALGAAGAIVAAVDRTAELVDQTRAQLTDMGARSIGIVADLREPEQVGAIVQRTLDELGRIDLVANIAGGTQPEDYLPLEDTPDDAYARTMALNLDYVFRVCRAAGKAMIASGAGGAIVNIASTSAFAAAPLHGPYGAAKRGVIALSQTMAVEWGEYGIRVNVVAPGATRTPRVERGNFVERVSAGAPLRRPVEATDVAAAVLFLLSDQARGVTGQTIYVDAGVSARNPHGPFERNRVR